MNNQEINLNNQNIDRKIKQIFDKYKLDKFYNFITGICLLIVVLILLYLLLFIDFSVEKQQVLIAIVGLIIIVALEAFKRILEDNKIFTPPINIIERTQNTSYSGDSYVTHNYTYHQKQNLAEAALEIKQLLDHLSENYQITTESEQNKIVDKAIEEIEHNPTFKNRIINAMKAGGIETLKSAINHPLGNIVINSFLEGFLEESENSSEK